MDVAEVRLRQVLEGVKQYRVPLYQRPYAWKARQLERLWSDLSELAAAERRDIKLVASRFLVVEAARWRGDPGVTRPGADALVEQYLEAVDGEWVELDLVVAREARRLSWLHHLRSGYSAHLAPAVRRQVDYFMSNDQDYPLGQTVDGVDIGQPSIVWQPTLSIK